MNIFSGKKQNRQPETEQDNVLFDMPRGEKGRKQIDNYLSKAYFESPAALEKVGFQDKAGHNFLGVINGKTEQIVRDDGRLEYKTLGGVPVGSLDDRHMTLVAGSRSGKGRSVIIPNLLTYAGSMIVIDPKGQNTAVTARYRAEELGHEVHVIDPFKITPEHCAKFRKQFNPLRILTPDNPHVVEDAGLIADAVVASASDRDPHWDETARAFIEGIILHVVTSATIKRKERTLLTVAELLFGKLMPLDELLEEMLDNESLEGRVKAAARAIEEKPKNERGSVISTARRHMKFCDYDAIYDVLSGHDFDLGELKTYKTTLYIVLPAMRLASCKGLLRLFVNMTLGMVERETSKPEYPIQMILDEMPVLGYMKELEAAIGQVAGLGLRLHCILQDLGQLKAIYKERYESFLGNSGILTFFGNVDQFSANWISVYLGKTTVLMTDQNALSLDDKNTGRDGKSQRMQVTDLLSAAEVRQFFARDDHMNRQLVFIPGRRPWVLQRVNYDQHDLFKGRFDEWR